MLKQIYLIDDNGRYMGNDILRENDTRKYTFVRPPQPCWKIIWNGDAWIETATEEEKNNVLIPQEPSLEDRIAELERINEEQYQTIQELSSLMKSSLLKKEGE